MNRSSNERDWLPALAVGDAYPPDAPMPAACPRFVAIVLIGSVPFAVALGRFRRTLGSMA